MDTYIKDSKVQNDNATMSLYPVVYRPYMQVGVCDYETGL